MTAPPSSTVFHVDAPPLLQLEDVRIESGGGPLLDGVSCTTRGARVGLLGPWDALFRLLVAEATVTAGLARVNGESATDALAAGKIGIALQDVRFPSRWQGLDYLIESARLAGLADAEARGKQAMGQLGLSRLAQRQLRVMAPAERRAILIAHATLTDPEVIVLEAPLDELDPVSAASLSAVVMRATEGRRLLVSIRDASLAGPSRGLLDTLDELLCLSPFGAVTRPSVSELHQASGRRYLAVVARQAGAFAEELRRRGVEVVELILPPPATGIVAEESAGEQPAQLLLRVGEGGTEAILDAAFALDLPLLHLAPAEARSADEWRLPL